MRKLQLWFKTRKWEFGIWYIRTSRFLQLQKLNWEKPRTCCLYTRQWFIPQQFLFALLLEWLTLCTASSHLFLFDVSYCSKVCREQKNKFIHKKWRNFDKNSLKAFNQIDVKKIKALRNTFWADFKRTCFFKKCKQKRVSFSWGIFKFIWAFLFSGETYA